jgi:hypothetical protein
MNKVVLLGGFLAVTAALIFSAHGMTVETVSVTITDKERVTNGTDSRYLIFTDKEVFENTDSTWFWKFNSSDLYGRIPVNATCELTVAGHRVKFMSWYRNILEVNCN